MLYDDTNNLLNELINCQICLNSFDENIHKPYSIYKCGHTYCVVCLNHINKSLNNKCPDCRSYIQNIAPNWQSLRILSFIKNNEQNKQQITLINKTKQNIQRKQRTNIILKYLLPKLKFVLFYAYYICLVALLIYSFSILLINFCLIDYRIPLWTIIYSLTKIALLNIPFKSDIISGLFIFIFFIIFILIWYFIGTLWMLELFYSTSVYEKITSNKCCFVTLIVQWILFGVWFLNITFNLIGEFISLILCYILFALFYIFIQSKK